MERKRGRTVFYISYYSADLSANPTAAVFVDDPANDYDNIYQYDPLGYTNLYEPSQYSRGKGALYEKRVYGSGQAGREGCVVLLHARGSGL